MRSGGGRAPSSCLADLRTASSLPRRAAARRCELRQGLRDSALDLCCPAMPRLVLVHHRIGGATGMGRVAAFVAQTALDAGWRVRLVASEVAPEFRERCDITRVPRPARRPQVRQDLVWYARVIRRLRRDPEDVVHVHDPALLRLADVMTCHHLAFSAHQHGVRVSRTGIGARARYRVRGTGLVVGYLGGDDQRKGVHIVRQLAGAEGIELLLAGPGTDRLHWPATTNVGFVDVDAFLPACDVVVAPALFDAAPTAVTQALARGVPMVVGRASGWAAPIARAGAGVVWDGRAPLVHAVREAARAPHDACRSITEAYSAARQGPRLLEVYERVLADRRERA